MFDKLFKKQQFKCSENQALFTCCHIIEENKPILYIKHDVDGDWQFLCGVTHTTEDGRIIAMKEVIGIDPSVSEVLNLRRGQIAQRQSKDDKWNID